MFDYKLIEALSQVVLKEGFENAAQALNLTQSAVSHRVKLLEDQVGQVLLKRSTPPTPTVAGQRLLKHYQQVRHLEQGVLELFESRDGDEYVPISIGVNIDSLTTWFLQAIQPFLEKEKVLLHMTSAFQQQTYELLRNGDCVGIISTEKIPMKGCYVEYLGKLNYRLYSTPAFRDKWFDQGLNIQSIKTAPAVTFSPLDVTLDNLLEKLIGVIPTVYPQHYIPSVTEFAGFIASGNAYGVLVDQQSAEFVGQGKIIDLSPDCYLSVELYWHCWKMESRILDGLSRTLVNGAKKLLE